VTQGESLAETALRRYTVHLESAETLGGTCIGRYPPPGPGHAQGDVCGLPASVRFQGAPFCERHYRFLAGQAGRALAEPPPVAPQAAAPWADLPRRGGRRMPRMWKIVLYWHEHPGAFGQVNLDGTPYCFRCLREVPTQRWPGWRDTWDAASPSLDRAHLIDRSAGGLDGPQNIVPLCGECHGGMPSFEPGDEDKAIAWVHAGKELRLWTPRAVRAGSWRRPGRGAGIQAQGSLERAVRAAALRLADLLYDLAGLCQSAFPHLLAVIDTRLAPGFPVDVPLNAHYGSAEPVPAPGADVHRVPLPVAEQDRVQLRRLGDAGAARHIVRGERALERGAQAGITGRQFPANS
jgi:hypothetical protein